MKHATIKLGDWVVPLIGVPRAATQETCDRCQKSFHITQMTVSKNGKTFLCKKCAHEDDIVCPNCFRAFDVCDAKVGSPVLANTLTGLPDHNNPWVECPHCKETF